MKPACTCCAPADEVIVTDAKGRTWLFEMHRFCGPLVLRRDGSPKSRQPGSRSPFWPAFEAWQNQVKGETS